MNKYIDYIKKMKQDENVDKETYIDLIKGFKVKLENWLMERPRFSDDPDFTQNCLIMYTKLSKRTKPRLF